MTTVIVNYGSYDTKCVVVCQQKEAMSKGHAQVLWLYGPERRITEVGAMNIMILLQKANGGGYISFVL